METGARDTPGLIAPPPLILAVPLGLALLWHRVRPLPLPAALNGPRRPLGIALIAGGLALGGWAMRTMRRAGTIPEPWHPATVLVTHGPFRVTRNPIYSGMIAVYLGITLLRNTLWSLLLLPVVLAVLRRGVIEREERYLTHRFSDAYTAYRARVRRWV